MQVYRHVGVCKPLFIDFLLGKQVIGAAAGHLVGLSGLGRYAPCRPSLRRKSCLRQNILLRALGRPVASLSCLPGAPHWPLAIAFGDRFAGGHETFLRRRTDRKRSPRHRRPSPCFFPPGPEKSREPVGLKIPHARPLSGRGAGLRPRPDYIGPLGKPRIWPIPLSGSPARLAAWTGAAPPHPPNSAAPRKWA